jgi:ATP-dependent Lhr-like helicase
MGALDLFTPPTRDWFETSFAGPTAAQERGWAAIADGGHTLIHAPTGSGKTLAAFLWAIDRLADEPSPAERERCRVLYVSPMKALAYDIERNLRAPLAGIQLAAERSGTVTPPISTAMRTGDTPAKDRRSMLRRPPDILITTPESLYLMLTSQAREILAPVRWVIVDEIHSVAGTKRGSHLSLSLERLSEVTTETPQRIGLSATQRPLEAIAEFLGGGVATEDTWVPNPVTIVDAPWEKELDVEIVVPVDDMTRPEETPVPRSVEPDDGAVRSIWPAVYPRLLDLVRSRRSTLLFVNSRGLAERLAAELNRLAGEELVQSHHGSVSREQRVEIEDRLKRGELKGVVATSTLELGIDMAAVDLVVLVESPSSVARGLQRVGRAGHQVGAASSARVFPKHRADLLETAVVVDRMYNGQIEETAIPRNPLDVLAQQIVAAVAVAPREVDELYELARRAAPYRDLPRSSYESVLDMLSGRYPSDEFAELRPRVIWDRVDGTLTARGNARMLAVTNPGTIPDRGLYTVTLPEGGKVGELDEEMVYESRPGDVFVLGSSSWKISEISNDRVIVLPAPGEATAKLPFWHGDAPGRPLELGKAVGEFVRTVGALDPADARATLVERYKLDARAAANLARFFEEEREHTGTLPTDRTIVVEQFRDEIGDWRTVLLSPFGARVHAPWALAARRRYRDQHAAEVDVIWSDDGIIFRFPDVDEPPSTAELILEPDEIEALVLEEAADSALFASRFREAAARALLLPRRRPGSRTPLWLQRRKAASLLEITKKYGSFPIILETYREVLQDHFDIPSLREVLTDIQRRTVTVSEVMLDGPSPFATSLTFDFIASFMYEYDAPTAEKRAAALTLDRSLLRELLGEPEFRELLDASVVADVELELQRLAPNRRISSADQMHDLLRDLGPLTPAEVEARSNDPELVPGWAAELRDGHRAVDVTSGGEAKLAAIEDVARLRDALGITPPQGVPMPFLEPVADPLGDVVARYARTHGPFGDDEAGDSLGLPTGVVEEVLKRLEASGRVASGAYRPGGSGQEWIDIEVLRRLRRRSLAVLRREVEAVDGAALGRFLPAWHGAGETTTRQDRLTEVIRQLQGASLSAGILESEILPARMSYNPAMLDDLLASGELVWLGRGSVGTRDGKVSLYLREQVPLLHDAVQNDPVEGPVHDALRGHLASRGASFFRDLYVGAEGGDPDVVLEALWDLVWAGEVTNDTLAPLRALSWKKARRSGRRAGLPSATPPAGSGRWYLVADLHAGIPALAEERGRARAEQLLDRYGVVTRDAVLAEGIPGGFAGLYPVFAAMEDAGRVRRGYFIEGLGGAQFGLPGAIDRLRSTTASFLTLSATDPANPYGAMLAWPQVAAGRLARRAGSHVVLYDGHLVAYVERGGRTLHTLDADHDAVALAAEVTSLARRRYRRMTIETIDDDPAAQTALGAALLADRFVQGYRGITFRDHNAAQRASR